MATVEEEDESDEKLTMEKRVGKVSVDMPGWLAFEGVKIFVFGVAQMPIASTRINCTAADAEFASGHGGWTYTREVLPRQPTKRQVARPPELARGARSGVDSGRPCLRMLPTPPPPPPPRAHVLGEMGTVAKRENGWNVEGLFGKARKKAKRKAKRRAGASSWSSRTRS